MHVILKNLRVAVLDAASECPGTLGRMEGRDYDALQLDRSTKFQPYFTLRRYG
jgi:hypothetical protein